MAVTMQDIARDLNVSVVTVSKALRNQGKISAATRKRVLQRAGELNYQPNWIARSLVTRRTFTIGLLFPNSTHPFFAEIAKVVSQTVRPRGYHVIISYFEEDPELERTEAEAFMARRVDGLVVASVQSDTHLFETMQGHKVPFVLIDRPVAGVKASYVGVDNEAIGMMATTHLVDQGCKRIAHLRGPELATSTGRIGGYWHALERGGLERREDYIVEAGYNDETGYAGMRKLLQVNPVPDGVFCYNDLVAIGAIRAVLDAGLSVPGDISLVGSGNVHYSDFLAVPLTTIDQGASRIATSAAELLLAQISSKRKLRTREVLIPPKLVVRQSTQRLREAKIRVTSLGREELPEPLPALQT